MGHLFSIIVVIVGIVLAIRKASSSGTVRRRQGFGDSPPIVVSPKMSSADWEETDDAPEVIRSEPVRLEPRKDIVPFDAQKVRLEETRFKKKRPSFHPEESSSVESKSKSKAAPFHHLTKEQLREGILLAEVLSEKPRALNPHPAVYPYQHSKK